MIDRVMSLISAVVSMLFFIPISIIADFFAIGGALMPGEKTYTSQTLEDIFYDLEQVIKPN